MITVNVPGLGQLQFPDGTPDSVMRDAIQRELAKGKASATGAAKPPLPSSQGLDTSDEAKFRSWYGQHASKLGLNSDPDDPRHHYDYRAAYKAGASPDSTGHWPSQFKADDHPNRYIDGVDTKTNKRVLLPWEDPTNPLVQAAARGDAMPTALAGERRVRPSDYVDRLGTAMLSNLSAPVDLVGVATDMAAKSPAMASMLPGGIGPAAALGSVVNTARKGLQAAEGATGLPFTSASQQQHRARFRELEKPGILGAPALEAATDTGIEMAGAMMDPVAAGLGAAKVAKVATADARIAAMAARVDDVAKQLATPPQPSVGPQLWAEFNTAKATIDAEVDAAVQQAIASGVEPPPQVIEQLRAGKLDALNTQWHERAATQAALIPEPSVHTLADATEQLAPFQPAPALADADLIALRDSSLRIAEVESRPDRVYRGTQLFSDNPNARTYVYRDPNTGEDVGYLLAEPVEGGFKVKNVAVEESHRGASIPEHLYTQASEELGPYKGSTDYAGRRTAAGTRMHERLQRTVPHVFDEAGSGKPLVPATDQLIRATDPKKSVRQVLTDTANRFIEEFSDKKEPIIRVLREAGLGERAREIELWLSQARGAARVAANTVWKGVRHWDAVSGNTTRAYDSLYSITGELGPTGWRDINDMLAAENHMELVGRKAVADTEYATSLATRRAEIEARRAAVTGARGANRAATSQGRKDLAQQLRATRNEAKASGEAAVRYANAKRSARMGREGELNTDLVLALNAVGRRSKAQDDLSAIGSRANSRLNSFEDVNLTEDSMESLRSNLNNPQDYQQPLFHDPSMSVEDMDAADASDIARRHIQQAARTGQSNLTTPDDVRIATGGRIVPDVLDMLTGTTKGVEQSATARYRKLPPLVQRPPDSTLKLDPRGTAWAKAKLAELQQRYGPDPATGTGVAQLGETARRIREWSWQAVVEQLDQVGYFTPEGKAALAAKRQQFAPFARLADEVVEDLGLTTGTHSKPVARISGGLSPDKPIAEPLESFVAQAQRIQLWVERQRVFNQLGDAAEAFPAELGDTIKRLPPNSKSGFQVFRDGVRHVYSAPDDVLRALGHADASQAGWLMQAAALATRTLRAGVTLSPDFAARNFVRDQSAAGVLGAEFKYRPFTDFLSGLWAQTPFASPELRNMVFKWESAGGALGDIISIERPQATFTGKAAAGIIDLPLIGRPVKVGKFVAKSVSEWRAEKGLGRIVYPFLRPLEGTASAVENATRVGAFMRAESKGASDLKASYYARNITLDFGRSGKLAQRWNSLEAFSNASLQDVARFSKALKEDLAGTTIKALTYITLPALATYALNRDNPDYQSRPQWEKASFYHLFQRDDKSWVMFPRPLGMLNLVYGYGIERMLDAMSGKYDEPVTELLSTVFNETPARYLPLQPDPDPNSAARGSYEWLPTFAQPAVEASAGEEGWSEFRHSPIVPRALIEQLPEDRYTDTSTQLSRNAGEQLGLAPLKIDHLIRNYGGTLAMQAIGLGERAAGASVLPSMPMTANDVPVVGAFVSGNPYGFATQPAQDFYAMEEAAHEAANSLEAASERLNTNPDKYYRIISDNPEALIADELASVKRDLAELRKTRNEYRTVPGMPPEMRAERLLQTDMLISQTLTSTMHWVANWRQGYLNSHRKDRK